MVFGLISFGDVNRIYSIMNWIQWTYSFSLVTLAPECNKDLSTAWEHMVLPSWGFPHFFPQKILICSQSNSFKHSWFFFLTSDFEKKTFYQYYFYKNCVRVLLWPFLLKLLTIELNLTFKELNMRKLIQEEKSISLYLVLKSITKEFL